MSDDTITRYRELADRLYRMTFEKKISWTADSFDQEIRCSLGKYYIAIDESQDGDGTPYIIIRIMNGMAEVIDAFSDATISQFQPENDKFETYWYLLSSLLKIAQRQSSGVDKALDEIFDALDDKDMPF